MTCQLNPDVKQQYLLTKTRLNSNLNQFLADPSQHYTRGSLSKILASVDEIRKDEHFPF